ncbi:MAG: class I SAM-dependent methyltransferase, partial [Richelia sp. SM1_7_0]|nr:class I SAM-dependent methyltransferase [Richelia sp. SM1_7_0]
PDGKLIAVISGLQVKPVGQPREQQTQSSNWEDWLYEVDWQEQPLINHNLQTPIAIANSISLPSPQRNQSNLESYASLVQQLEELSIISVVQTFQKLQLPLQLGDEFSTTEAILTMGIVNEQQKLCHRLLQMLNEAGVLQKSENWQVSKVIQPIPASLITSTFANLWQNYPNATAELNLLERCTSDLADILQGKSDPIQLLFPNGDFSDLTQLYQNSPVAQVMNTLVQQAVVTAIKQIPSNSTLRILEIGAGTGGTTAHILSEFSIGREIEYFFTDVSPLFLSKAQQQFSQYSGVRYQLFDVEKSLSSQGLTENHFDIVIAANVLHATQDLRQTTTHIQQLLSPGGLLVLLEGVYPVRWLDLIFGLTEGWWRFQDYSLRPDYPLISTAKWQKLLENVEFESSALLRLNNSIYSSIFEQQAVIVAQTPLLPSLSPKADKSESWLILADNSGVAEKLAADLEMRGISCLLVFAGEDYRVISENTYQVNPIKREDIKQCFSDILLRKPLLSQFVNLWSLDVPSVDELPHAKSQRRKGKNNSRFDMMIAQEFSL